VSNIELIIIAALAAQIPLLALAFLLEFSLRKRRERSRPDQQPHPEEAIAQAVRAMREAQAPPEVVPPADQGAREPEPPSETTAQVSAPPTEPPPIESAAPPAEVAERAPTAPAEEAAPSIAPAAAEAEPPPVEPAAESGTALAARREPVRLGLGLRKTRENFLARIRAAISGSARADEIYEGLEEALIGADVGVEASLKIIEGVRARLKNDARADVIRSALKEEIESILAAAERPLADPSNPPLVILMVGVNGTGKTTTVAKLAARLKGENTKVIVAAGDTFRAAAIEQLQVWCERAGVDLIQQKQGSDPAAVAFDAVKAAVARGAGAVIIDTAGRLQTKVNLMEELKKIARVVGRELPGAPHETWLVLDATTGQNALSQAKLFGEAVPLTGVVLAKLDGTAKGGVIIAIAERLKLPVRFVGLGEGLEDLRPFAAHEFVEALFAEGEEQPEAATGTYAA
jgi:fused signal recognition particle receptor